jgi:hypothetical protein
VRTVISIFLLCIIGILAAVIFDKNQKIKELKEKSVIAEGKYNLLVERIKEKRDKREQKNHF